MRLRAGKRLAEARSRSTSLTRLSRIGAHSRLNHHMVNITKSVRLPSVTRKKGQTLIPLDISIDPGDALRRPFEGRNPICPASRHQNPAHSNRHTLLLFCYWIKDREHGLGNSLLSPGEWGRLAPLEQWLADSICPEFCQRSICCAQAFRRGL